jgi:hypothetical protein
MKLFHPAQCGRWSILTVVWLVLFCFPATDSLASPTSHTDLDKLEKLYLGVSSCASTVCHGGTTKSAGNVLQNEYRTWFKYDAHAKAYETLLSEDSKIIASHLGISAPEKDAECLQCHSTYVKPEHRGDKFRLADGVGCESCHGPARQYIKAHTAKGRSHPENLNDGLTNLVSPAKRSAVCLDCHQGNGNKRVDHRLIGSGHPRLSFELDTYSANLPMHWNIDKDYLERKGEYDPARHWAVGQAERARQMLAGHLHYISQMTKDGGNELNKTFSDYYCYKCHHSLSDKQWKTRTYGGKPGEIHLNLSSLEITRQIIQVFDKPLAEILLSNMEALKDFTESSDKESTLNTLVKLLTGKIIPLLSDADYNEDMTKRLLENIVIFTADTAYLPYEVAEQCAMALSSLSSQIKKLSNEELYRSDIESLFFQLRHEFDYKPENFTEAAIKFKMKLKLNTK